MPKRRVIMFAVGTLAVIAVASTSALITLALARGGPNEQAIAVPASASSPTTPSATTTPPPPPAAARATPAVTTPVAPRVAADPPTKVQITHWGAENQPPKETVTLTDGCPGSNLLIRQDAMRCYTTPTSSGSTILDPCFEIRQGEGLMCPSAPWSTEWTLISAQGNSGNTDPPTTQGLPWGVEIAGGIRCLQASGATTTISGLRANYYCPNDSWLYGDPSRGSTWHLKSATTPKGPLHPVALRKVWF